MEDLKVVTIRRHRYGGKARQIGEKYFVDHPKHLKFLVVTKQVRVFDAKAEAAAKKAEEAKKKALSEAAKKGVETRRRNQQRSRPGGRYERKDVSESPENKKANPVKNENNIKGR